MSDSTQPPPSPPLPSLPPLPSPPSNPYQPPAAQLHPARPTGVAESDQKNLIVPLGWHSPPICLFTGETENLRPACTKTLSWVNPWLGITVLFGVFPYLLLALITQKKGTIVYYISAKRAALHRKRNLIVLGMFLLGIAVTVAGSSLIGRGFSGVGVLVVMMSLLMATTYARFMRPVKIDKFSIHLAKIPLEARQKIVQADRASRGL